MTVEQQGALEASQGLEPTPKNLERVAQSVGAELSQWAFTQWGLRQRARTKFGRADEMLFTRPGLEMATDQVVAQYHASLFPTGEVVADLTCGIGGDTIALAQRGPVIAFETDAATAEYCRHNLKVHGLEADVRSETGDIERLLKERVKYFFLDPARRDVRGRVRSLERYQPNPLELAPQLNRANLAAIKLSPMLSYEELCRLSYDLSFLSHRWECCEALLRMGTEAMDGKRAVQVETGDAIEATGETVNTETPLAYVYEADPALVKAHAVGSFGMPTLGTAYGILTSDEFVRTTWLRPFKTVWNGAFRMAAVEEVLASLGAGLDSVKVRNLDVDPIQVKKSLRAGGVAKLTLLVYPFEKRARAALLERIVSGTP